jgi:hypothetical protein
MAEGPLGLGLDIQLRLAQIEQLLADRDRKRQEPRLASWSIAASLFTAGAAVLAAAAALVKILRP